METCIVFINDAEFAKRHLLAYLEGRAPQRWVLVGCPPRLPRHSGRFLSQPALKRWRADWTREALRDIVSLLAERGHEATTRVATVPLVAFTRQLRGEIGQAATLIDIRRPRTGASLEPIVPEQPREQSDTLRLTAGALAMGAVMALAAD